MLNVLVVTDQKIRLVNGVYYCQENVYDILKRFLFLGKLNICCPQKDDNRGLILYNSSISPIIDACGVFFVEENYLYTSKRNKKILELAIKKTDIVIGYVPCVNAYAACELAKKYNKKFLSYVVGCPWDAYWNHSFIGKIIAPYAYYSLKKCLKKSDYALYVTEHFLQKRYPCFGMTCGCSDVRIPNITEDVLNKHLKQLYYLSEDVPLKISTIANYSVKYKGQHYVIKALACLKKIGVTKFHYHLIGGGNKERLEKLAKKLNVAEFVHFEGIVPHNKIFEKLDEMHLYIQPSLQEGLPRSVVEAMSRGLLCICANTAAMPEMVDPEYIIERKSVNDIVRVLQNISIEILKNQAIRNFNEARKYEDSLLDEKRNTFFQKIKNEME